MARFMLGSSMDQMDAPGPTPHYKTVASAAGLPPPAGPGPENGSPVELPMTFGELMGGLNPLHHLPVLGMVYRGVTGDTIPIPMRILGAGIFGGPMGMVGAALTCLASEIFSVPPDTSRPALPAGMSQSAEAGMQPGSPEPGGYVTLATVAPDWLGGITPDQAASAYRLAEARGTEGHGMA